MNFIDLSDTELIEYCKNNNIQYLQKNKKLYKRKTLLSNINKYNMELSKKEDYNIEEKKEEIYEVKEINEIIWTLEKNKDINIKYNEIKTNLHNIIKRCHQLLYSSHSIVGMKAQNDIMKLLTLKILQPQFANKESDLYKSCEKLLENKEISKENYDKYMSYCLDLNNLLKEENLVLSKWEFFIKRFLSKILSIIYNDEDIKFNNNDAISVCKLIKIINEININDDFIDAFSTSYGDIHEAFREYGGGKGAKELGQFFTPRNLIHSIFYGCELNDIIKTYNNPTIYDPCMGTAGLLTRAYSNGNILPNNIYGCETEKDTIKFGECSLLLTTKCFNSNIERCDSLCKNPFIFTNKFDIIFTNPPFGTKMNYIELEKKFNDFKKDDNKSIFDKIDDFNNTIDFKTIYPIKTNNGACLFIQHCIYMLKENGICAIVLPDGELFTGKSYKNFREYLCENVNILKIINVEGGAFEHTSIKTSTIIFKNNGQTKNIEYLKINKECNEVSKIAIVNIKNIKKENYDFNLSKYIKKEKENIKYEIKILGEICEIKNGKNITKDKLIDGEYYVVGGGLKPLGKHNEYNVNENTIIISKDGAYAGYVSRYNTKIFVSNHGLYIDNLNENILKDYIYYYLKLSLQDKLYNLQTGTAQPGIKKENIENIEIPIPPLKVQEKIINDVEKLIKSIETIKIRNEQLKDEGELFMEYYKKSELESLFKKAEIKKLGDVCIFQNGKGINKSELIEGEYPVIGGGKKPLGFHNNFNRDENTILCSSSGCYSGYISKYLSKIWASDCFSIKPNEMIINNNYLYYYLVSKQEEIYKLQKGNAQPHVYSSDLSNLEIPIPPLEIQEKIIEVLDNIYKKIEENNKNIEFNNELIKIIMSQIK
jgi:restriction endonuclease S subunit